MTEVEVLHAWSFFCFFFFLLSSLFFFIFIGRSFLSMKSDHSKKKAPCPCMKRMVFRVLAWLMRLNVEFIILLLPFFCGLQLYHISYGIFQAFLNRLMEAWRWWWWWWLYMQKQFQVWQVSKYIQTKYSYQCNISNHFWWMDSILYMFITNASIHSQ